MKRNFFRLLLSAVLMMCCTVMANAQAQAPAGDGSKGNPYQITNFYQLYWFSFQVYQGNKYACAILMNDIESDDSPWIPIGYNDEHVYCGEFDGNGHVIKGLHYDREEVDVFSGLAHKDNCLGLFGKIDENGSVHDVGVENCYFYGQNRVGAICGDLASGEVYNCWSSGYICVNTASGGLVGSCWYDGILRNCYTSCNVVVSLYTDQYVGGVCGSVAGKVENCFMMEKTGGWAEKPIGATYGETSVINNVVAKPESVFNSGELCWTLNGGVTDGSQVWYQTIGTDNMPTLSKSSKTVSRCRAKCTSDNYIYNNDMVEMDANHALAYRPKYSCASTGYDTEYWECLGCHKLFADKECTHEINQSDLGEAKSGIDVTKDSEWLYTDKIKPIGSNLWFNSCYYIDTPAPYDGKKTTSISFKVNVDDYDFSFVWYFNQWGEITGRSFHPDAIINMTFTLNGEVKYTEEFAIVHGIAKLVDGHWCRSLPEGTWFGFGRLRKGDVVKIEIHLRNLTGGNRNNQIIFSVPQAVHPTHQFKHINASSLYSEHWECEHCHNLFASDAHPDSDKDICSLDDLAYEEPKKNDGYYEISNKYMLYWLAREVNENGKTAIKARLTADIKVNNNVLDQNGNLNDASSFRSWTPIGNNDYPFIGEFDGDGHTISGLYQKDDNWDAGLFGYMTTGGKIKNVIVKDSYLFGQYPTWKEGQQGKICYRNWNGGSVTDSYISMGKVLGGYVSLASNSERYVTDAEFNSGEATWMLNGEKIDTKWRQQMGKDAYPVLTGNYLVNHSEEKGFYNETMCEKENGIHSFEKKVVTKCDNSTVVYWYCSACGKDFTDADRTKEETVANKSSHFPDYVMGIVPTETTEGCYGHYKCTKCSEKFKDEPCHQPWANDNDLIVPKSNNNEIWYTSTKNQTIKPNTINGFGATITDNKYEYGIGVITFDKDVTSIGKEAFFAGGFNTFPLTECVDLQSISIPSAATSIGEDAFLNCTSLQSINIPSSVTSIEWAAISLCTSLQSINIPDNVTSIGEHAFQECSSLQSVTIPNSVTSIGEMAFAKCKSLTTITFNSLPVLGTEAFYPCDNLNNRILDLTDSDKPYIGNKMNDYHPFTEAHYHRTLANDGTWGTIVLPFKPSSTEGLKFYALQSMATGGEEGGTLTFMKVDAPDAGIPYLFRNEGESADFTLTAEKPSIILETQEIGPTDFKMKGSFQQVSLNTTEKKNDNLYYLKDNEFYHANGQINIAPFRAYIEGSGATLAKSFMLVISDNGENITNVPGIMNEDGTLDETEAIYDLSGRRLAAPVKGQINIIRTKSGKTIKRMF